ncbi:MAG: hypothetical protein ACBR23_19400, partial [Microcoleus sp.]
MPWFVKIEQGIVEKPVFDKYVPAHRAYVVHLRDTFQISWTSQTHENTSIASPARVKGVPAKAFSIMPKA